MNDFELRKILSSTPTVASVGMSANPDKPGNYVPGYLLEHGFHVIPVNPTATEILGQKSYPDLLAVPEPVEIVQVFRPPEDVPPIVDQAIKIGAKIIWMQPGTVNPEAAERAREAGLSVVADRCMMVEHKRLIGP